MVGASMREKNKPKSSAPITVENPLGSRFSVLGDQQAMEMDGGAVNMEENLGNTPNMLKSKDIPQGKVRGKENRSIEVLNDAIAAIRVSVSHVDLTDRLKSVAGVRYELDTQNLYNACGTTKTTKRPLKDISNTPYARPNDLKHNYVGSQTVDGQQIREARLLK